MLIPSWGGAVEKNKSTRRVNLNPSHTLTTALALFLLNKIISLSHYTQQGILKQEVCLYRSTSLTAGLSWGFNTKWSFSKEINRTPLNGSGTPHTQKALSRNTQVLVAGISSTRTRLAKATQYEKPGGGNSSIKLPNPVQSPRHDSFLYLVVLPRKTTWSDFFFLNKTVLTLY